MLLQANISLLDLSAFLERLTPLAIGLSDTGSPVHAILVGRPDRVELVPNQGLRVVAPLRLSCTFAGVRTEIAATSAQLLLRPAIVVKNAREELGFSFHLEALDLRHLPAMVDDKIVERVNAALTNWGASLSWDFLKTLTFGFDMPARMSSLSRLSLKAHEGMVRITDEGLQLTVSFDTDVLLRAGEAWDRDVPASGGQ